MASFSRARAVAKFALLSRFFVVMLQFLSNIFIPDHDAGVFSPPLTDQESFTWIDSVIFTILGGFRRWDAVYFLHIAEHGYTYENCVAFFPLYPILVSSAKVISFLCPMLSVPACLLLFGVALNVVVFVAAALLLLHLSEGLLEDKKLAYYAAMLFCINPASIFMTAPYTETLFACLTFGGILGVTKGKLWQAALLFGASAMTRSNGLVSLGFLLHSVAVCYFMMLISLWRNLCQQQLLLMRSILQETLLQFWRTFFLVAVSIAPFALYQYYIYQLFCFPEKQEDNIAVIPESVVNYGRQQRYKLLGDRPVSPWCLAGLPLSYSYIQTQHWGVGLMVYYQLKNIPRFIMAAPIFILSVSACWSYYKRQPEACHVLGLITLPYSTSNTYSVSKKWDGDSKPDVNRDGWDSEKLVVYILHLLFLLVFGTLFMHIEVLTRFLCSASPVIYWYAAHIILQRGSSQQFSSYIEAGQQDSSITVLISSLLQDYKCCSVLGKLVVCYFLLYLVIGTVAFSNFLPWT